MTVVQYIFFALVDIFVGYQSIAIEHLELLGIFVGHLQ